MPEPEQDCLPHVQACRLRAAVLGGDGVPEPGADNLYVTDAMAELAIRPVYLDGESVQERNACGDLVVNLDGEDSLARFEFTLTLLRPDPYLLSILLDGSAVLSDGARRGFAAPPLGKIGGNGVSLELWAKRVDDGDLDASSPYAWWAYPKAKHMRLGDHTHNSGALRKVITGKLFENPNWFDGPLNDWPATSDRAFQWIPTDVLPEVNCGPLALAAS